MTEIWEAIILGLIQGLTEFLPVSSSGHLELAKYFLGDESLGEESLLMTVVLHFATALSTIVVFRKDVFKIIGGLFSKQYNAHHKFSFHILISMIPAVIIGLIFEEEIESLFTRQILMVGVFLLITAVLLILADRTKKTIGKVGVKEAVIIGLAQAFAILPGVSRSGSTIATSVLLKVDRDEAAKFSFLMVVPLIFGKIAKDLLSGDLLVNMTNAYSLIAGFMAAFITGIIACRLMITVVRSSKLKYFAFYCIILGAFAIIWILSN